MITGKRPVAPVLKTQSALRVSAPIPVAHPTSQNVGNSPVLKASGLGVPMTIQPIGGKAYTKMVSPDEAKKMLADQAAIQKVYQDAKAADGASAAALAQAAQYADPGSTPGTATGGGQQQGPTPDDGPTDRGSGDEPQYDNSSFTPQQREEVQEYGFVPQRSPEAAWVPPPAPPGCGPPCGFGDDGQTTQYTCYMQNGIMCCVSILPTEWGIVPLMSSVKVKGEYPDGPVSEGQAPELDAAIAESKKRLMTSSRDETQKLAAEALVIRARCGDQNAMAIIALVSKNARKGMARSQTAFKAIQSFIARNPVKPDTVSGEGASYLSTIGANSVNRAAVKLANGPALSNQRVGDMVAIFGGPGSRKRRVLFHGITRFGNERDLQALAPRLDEAERALLDFGRSIGMARGVQSVRAPGGRIANMSADAAWELGE